MIDASVATFVAILAIGLAVTIIGWTRPSPTRVSIKKGRRYL